MAMSCADDGLAALPLLQPYSVSEPSPTQCFLGLRGDDSDVTLGVECTAVTDSRHIDQSLH